MHNQVVLLFFLHSAAALCPLGDAATHRGEFTKLEGYEGFIPESPISVLEYMSDIPSLIRCYTQCIFNPFRLTATFDEDLRLCRLFSADAAQGRITDESYSKVSSLIDWSKK